METTAFLFPAENEFMADKGKRRLRKMEGLNLDRFEAISPPCRGSLVVCCYLFDRPFPEGGEYAFFRCCTALGKDVFAGALPRHINWSKRESPT